MGLCYATFTVNKDTNLKTFEYAEIFLFNLYTQPKKIRMKRYILTFLLGLFFYQHTFSQVGENYLNLGLDARITINDYYVTQFPAGFGASVKGLLGVGLNGQVTVSAAWLYFPLSTNFILPAGDNISFQAIPAFLGYRFTVDKVFFEPQLGAAIHVTRSRISQSSDNISATELGFAAEAGYGFDLLEISLRYQHTGQSPFHLGMLAFRTAYRIPIGY